MSMVMVVLVTYIINRETINIRDFHFVYNMKVWAFSKDQFLDKGRKSSVSPFALKSRVHTRCFILFPHLWASLGY